MFEKFTTYDDTIKTVASDRTEMVSVESLQCQTIPFQMSRPITRIIIHCTATPEGRDHTIGDVRKWHVAQGWRDVGYHYLIRLDGTVEAGRPFEQAGAHTRGHNADSIGIAYVGGCDSKMKPKDTRTVQQKCALRHEVERLRKLYPTITEVKGHNDYDKGKACPSFNVATEL